MKKPAPKNMSDLAKQISECEGGKQSLSIAQIKEVVKILCTIMAVHPLQTIKLLSAHAQKQVR